MIDPQTKIWTLDELVNDKSVAPQAIVDEGVLLPNSLLLILGPPKVGKSFFAMNMALAIASGKGFAGFKVCGPEKVLHLSAEGGYYSNRERLRRMSSRYSKQDPVWQNFMGSIDIRTMIDDEKGMTELRELLKNHSPRVLILDPLVRFHRADENSAKDMSGVLAAIRTIMTDYDLSAIVVHHEGKSGRGGARGSSVITGEYDSCIELKRERGAHSLSFDMRHVETPANRKVQFNRDTLWFESVNSNSIVGILQDAGRPLEKREIVKECERRGIKKYSKNAYPLLNEAIRLGEVRENADGRLSLSEWPPQLSVPHENLEHRKN